MRKIVFIVMFVMIGMTSAAQNLQLHYDFGRDIYSDELPERQKLTLTFEHFSTDKAGSWYYFVDMDFLKDGACGAYTEISREFNVGKQGFAAHVEYNGGLCSTKSGNFGARYQHAALIGPAYNGHNEDFSTTYSLQLMYKQYFKGQGGKSGFPSVQLTGVWSTTFANKALTFAGFFDFWRDVKANGHGKLVFASEPQLWYNLNSIKGMENFPLSIGTEVELYNNFYSPADGSDKTFYVIPTIGLKWKL